MFLICLLLMELKIIRETNADEIMKNTITMLIKNSFVGLN